VRTVAVAAVAAAVLALTAAPALAHVITRAQMRTAAGKAAASIKKQTGASSTRVLKCRRSSDHRGRCGVESLYDSGATRCVTKVGVRLVGTRPRWRTGTSACY
jgi:predicted secreted Zn-dependent protease